MKEPTLPKPPGTKQEETTGRYAGGSFPKSSPPDPGSPTLPADGGRDGAPPSAPKSQVGSGGHRSPCSKAGGTAGSVGRAVPGSPLVPSPEEKGCPLGTPKGAPPVTRCSGHPTKAALTLRTARAGDRKHPAESVLCACLPPVCPTAPHRCVWDPAFHRSFQGLSKGQHLSLPWHGLGGRHPSGFSAPEGISLAVPLPGEQAPPLSQARLEGASRRSPRHAPSAHGLTEDLSSSGQSQSSPGQRKETQGNEGKHFRQSNA